MPSLWGIHRGIEAIHGGIIAGMMRWAIHV